MRNRASRSRWAVTRAQYAGPRWRRAVYWSARGLALITVGWAIGLGMMAGAAASWAANVITDRLTRVEGWAWPGMYAPRPPRRSEVEAEASWVEAWAAERTARGAQELADEIAAELPAADRRYPGLALPPEAERSIADTLAARAREAERTARGAQDLPGGESGN